MSAALSVCLAVGCSGERRELENVQGVVTLGKTPVPKVLVMFVPADKSVASARGVTDIEGRFSLQDETGERGVEKGEYKVVFLAMPAPSGAGAGAIDWRQRRNPATTPHRATVPAGGVELRFDLQSP